MINCMTTIQGIDVEPNYDELIGEIAHALMWRKHLTQTQVASILGIAQPTLNRKLRGTRPWAVNELYALAAALDVPVTDLLPEQRHPRPDNSPDGGESAPCETRTRDLRIKRLPVCGQVIRFPAREAVAA